MAIYERLLADVPRQPKIWLNYAQALRTLGRHDEAVAAYRRSIALAPGLGAAYWGLANLKVAQLTADEEAGNRARARRPRRAGRRAGPAALRPRQGARGPRRLCRIVRPLCRRREGPPRREPLRRGRADRAGRAVEGAVHGRLLRRARRAGLARSGADLHRRPAALGLDAGRADPGQPPRRRGHHGAARHRPHRLAPARRAGGYPEALASLGADRLRALGEVLHRDHRAASRRCCRPFFTDKMPNNFQHIGLIQLILPNAKIIDVRRHPMGAGFSVFKQHFAQGQSFSYDLADIGRYYRDYVALMRHFDQVLPGRVHRVIYEDLVEDTEAEVRRLLDACGLAVRARVSRLPRKRPRRPHRQLRTSPPPHLPRRPRPLARLRTMARPAERRRLGQRWRIGGGRFGGPLSQHDGTIQFDRQGRQGRQACALTSHARSLRRHGPTCSGHP